MLTPGTIIDGRFEIVDFIGEGGMGTVYCARHTAIDRQIALKLLKSSLMSQEEKVARFRNEARVLSGLDHPNIIAVHAVGVSESGQPYMAMDIVRGESVSDIIRTRGPFSEAAAIRLCMQICDGLQYAHEKNIIHRDIKPSNIIVTTDGGTTVAKLVDFGIAKMLDPQFQQLTQTGVAMGSIFYLSPGQIQGRAADPSSDIYSLGCTLYEMLAGVPPFQAETFFETAMMHQNEALVPVKERNPKTDISDALQRVINCALQKDSSARYSSAADLTEDLACVLDGRPLKHAGTAKAQTSRSTKISRMKRSRLILFGAALLISLVGTGLFVMQIRVPKKEDKPISRDLPTEAKEAIADATRAYAAAGRDYDRLKQMLPLANHAKELAKQSADELLIAQAAFVEAIAKNRAHEQDKDVATYFKETKDLVEYASLVANHALALETDPARIRALHKIRFEAYDQYFNWFLAFNQPLPAGSDATLYEYFIDARPLVQGDELIRYMGDTAALVRVRLQGDSQQRIMRALQIRGDSTRLLRWTVQEREDDFSNLMQHQEHRGPAFLQEAREAYGLN